MLIFLFSMQIDIDNSGFINISELGDALATVGLKLPAYEVRDLIRHSDTKIRDDCLDFEEFKVVSEKKQNCISVVFLKCLRL